MIPFLDQSLIDAQAAKAFTFDRKSKQTERSELMDTLENKS